MAAISLLFLVSCQQTQNDDPKGLTTRQENPSGFNMLGDPRDPSEFMSPEKLKMIQDAFEGMENKSLKNSVKELLETRGTAKPHGPKWLLEEEDIPVANINGEYLYLAITMEYYPASNSFSTSVSYRFGKDVDTYSPGWYSEGNTEVYVMGDKKLLLEYGVNFEIDLVNHPQYSKAKVTFLDPIQMEWDQRNGANFCEVNITPQRIKVTYL